MHEHGVADRILEAILQHPDRPKQGRPLAVTVVVSELGGPSPDALQASLNHVCEHMGLPEIELNLKTVELLGQCRTCGRIGAVDPELVCPFCEATDVRLCGGETVVVESCRYG